MSGVRVHTRRLQDIFTTLIQYSWPVLLFIIGLCYLASWLVFAGLWHLIVVYHGDLDSGGGGTCVVGMYNFASSLLLSMELQQTIGYGSRAPSDQV